MGMGDGDESVQGIGKREKSVGMGWGVREEKGIVSFLNGDE